MTLFQFFVTYVTCWWLVLFMVLPYRANAPKTPGMGHAPSAPADPQIKKKMKWTTLLAIIPAVALFAIVSAARAEDSIYHASSHPGKGCKPVNATTAADVNARDGYGTDGSKVAPATLGGQSQLVNTDHIDIPLQIPTAKYLEPQAQNAAASTSAATSASASAASNTTASAPVHNVDVSESFANMGKLSIGQDGSATLNGKPIAQTGDCQ